ncbi:hypothetical protein ACRXCV_04285 [Halobacteriovorax sp. GFR7]|uniref:hypothetical protein n=1 Tax=unclassified Halobacteriovorax TaxID=2639665 RepID=UPI003D964FC9
MKSVVVLLSVILFSSAMACPELNNVDLASSYDRDEYTEVYSERLPKLSKEEFAKYTELADFDYDYCADALELRRLEATQTGTVYTIVVTVEDHCDGGNSYGNIFDESGSKLLGRIGDSYIACF